MKSATINEVLFEIRNLRSELNEVKQLVNGSPVHPTAQPKRRYHFRFCENSIARFPIRLVVTGNKITHHVDTSFVGGVILFLLRKKIDAAFTPKASTEA